VLSVGYDCLHEQQFGRQPKLPMRRGRVRRKRGGKWVQRAPVVFRVAGTVLLPGYRTMLLSQRAGI
jgi:hypothetical protein